MMQKLKLKYIQTQKLRSIDSIFSTPIYTFLIRIRAFVCVSVCVSLKKPKTSVKSEVKFIEVNKNKWAD